MYICTGPVLQEDVSSLDSKFGRGSAVGQLTLERLGNTWDLVVDGNFRDRNHLSVPFQSELSKFVAMVDSVA